MQEKVSENTLNIYIFKDLLYNWISDWMSIFVTITKLFRQKLYKYEDIYKTLRQKVVTE